MSTRSRYTPSEPAADLAFWEPLVFPVGLIGVGATQVGLCALAGLWTLQPWGLGVALVGAALTLVSLMVPAFGAAIAPERVVDTLADVIDVVSMSGRRERPALAYIPVEVGTTRR